MSGIASANLKDVTLVETLEAVRDMYGYDDKIDGARISMRLLIMQTGMFQANYLTAQRRGMSNTRVSSTSVADAGNNNNGNGSGNGGGPGLRQPGWMGLGMSLQAEGRDAEAAGAFGQTQASATLPPELHGFVERRLRQLGR